MRPLRSAALLPCMLLGLPLWLTAPLVAQSKPFVVISAGKGWRINGNLARRGQQVGDADRLSSAGKEIGQVIVDCKPEWVAYACDRQCQVPPCTAKSDKSAGIAVDQLGPFAKLTESLLRREPSEIAILGVRAGGSPSDSVLLQDMKGVHWGPALNRVLEGRYCFRLKPLPEGAARTFSIDWDRETDAEGTVAVPNLAPGIYTLEKGKARGTDCEIDRESTAAWVAIASERRFPDRNAEWKELALRISQVERSDAGPAAATVLRHAALASLAESLSSR